MHEKSIFGIVMLSSSRSSVVSSDSIRIHLSLLSIHIRSFSVESLLMNNEIMSLDIMLFINLKSEPIHRPIVIGDEQ